VTVTWLGEASTFPALSNKAESRKQKAEKERQGGGTGGALSVKGGAWEGAELSNFEH
jgi:hypothetical protein